MKSVKLNKRKGKKGRRSQKYSHPKLDLDTDEHELSLPELSKRFGTDLEKGLSRRLVEKSLRIYGSNEVKPPRPKSTCYRLMQHSLQGLSSVLFAGAIVCFMSFIAEVVGNLSEEANREELYLGTTLVLFMFLTGLYSFFKERNALALLRKVLTLVSHDCNVIRDGEKVVLNAQALVVGDLVELKFGDYVPADIRVTSVAELRVDDSTLSGYSEPKVITVECTSQNPLETSNLLFASTLVLEGTCRGIVIHVGVNTLAGRISTLTSNLEPKQTVLGKETTTVVLTYTIIALLFGLMFWATAMSYDHSWPDATIYFVSTCVAIVPESLLIAINVSHTLAGTRMMEKNCVAKHFEAIENLGCTSVVCLDKTGTLTQNKMSVSHIWAAGDSLRTVLEEKILESGDSILPATQAHFKALLRSMILTSRSTFKSSENSKPFEVHGREPGDIAVLRFAVTNLSNAVELIRKNQRVLDVPFSYRDFYQLSIHRLPADTNLHLVVKGAPEVVFRLCSTFFAEGNEQPITDEFNKKFETMLTELGNMEERVIGFCDMIYDSGGLSANEIKLQYPKQGYRFLGFASMTDPPRITAPNTVSRFRSASVKVIMVTGDHPATAIAIARAVGIFSEGVETANDIAKRLGVYISALPKEQKTAVVLTGGTLSRMSRKDLDSVIEAFSEIVFARVSPSHKMYIVESCRRLGAIVSMIGDGINDISALRAADISIAMGIGSSEAAKQISDIVLLDNNLASVVEGIGEGRLIFENLKKATAFTVTSNIAEILPFLCLLILRIPSPLNPMGILMISIGTDLFPAVALVYEKAESDLMASKPRGNEEKLVTRFLIGRCYNRIGILQFLAGSFAYILVMAENGFRLYDLVGMSRIWYFNRNVVDSENQDWTHRQREDVEHAAQTAYFFAVVLTQLVNAICCKNIRNSIFLRGLNNWRLNVGLCCQLLLAIIIAFTQAHHILEHSEPFLTVINVYWLLPGIPFAVFIFVYDEGMRFIARRWPTGFISRNMHF